MIWARSEALIQSANMIGQNDEPFLKGSRCGRCHCADEWTRSCACAEETR
jgi:hypothetical protein